LVAKGFHLGWFWWEPSLDFHVPACLGRLMYHSGKTNVVADALSRKSIYMSALMIEEYKLIEQFRDLNLEVKFHIDHISCGKLTITNEFFGRIKEKQWRILI